MIVNQKAVKEALENVKPATLVAATKYIDAKEVKKLAEAGCTIFGENRVQDFLKKYEEYDGEKTERAGTLFDKEVDFRETRLHDKDRGETLNERKARRQRKFFGWGEYDHY